MSDPTGGQAFPTPGYIADANHEHYKWPTPGMTLRDYFAAHAVVEVDIPNLNEAAISLGIDPPKDSSYAARMFCYASIVAKARYLMADGMLAAREKWS
jgi:hypothetical protein